MGVTLGYNTSKKLIRQFVEEYPVTGSLDCIQYVEKAYTYVKERKEGYSYIQFSIDMGFSATNIMHQIIRGYRKLTLKAAKKLTAGLNLTGTQRKYFEALVEYRNETIAVKRDEIFGRLVELKRGVLHDEKDQEWLDFFAMWYHPIVAKILELDQANTDPKWVASQVQPPITEDQAKESIELLMKLGIVELDEEANRYRPKEFSVSSGHEVTGIGFIRYHQRMIELAKDSITRVTAEERDISSITFSCDRESIGEVKKMIHEFNEKLQAHLESVPKKKDVVQLNIQLFPVSKKSEE